MSFLTDHSLHTLSTHAGKAAFDPQTAQYVYVLVRRDLSPAQQGVQAVHAGMAATAAFGGLTHDTRLALLGVDHQDELQSWMQRLEANHIPFQSFWEPDRHTGFSALATAPISRRQGRVFSRLSMWDPLSALSESCRPTLPHAALA